MARILIVEDDRVFSGLLEKFLSKNGYQPETARSAANAAELMAQHAYDFVISDYRLPDTTGIELMHQLRKAQPELPVLLVTGYSDTRVAVQAMKQGAVDYVLKPVNPEEVLHTIRTALATSANLQEQPPTQPQNTPAPPHAGQSSDNSFISGTGPAMQQLMKHVDLVAPTELSVIIQGESGTGKEYLAREIYRRSKRVHKPFVALDCGTLTGQLADSELFGHAKGAFTGALNSKKGQFEHASGGTLFLDEVGNLSYEVQVKLLRALQERKIRRIGENDDIPVDVRIITATNDDLRDKVANGAFREDLYHRLNEFSLLLPPVRDRGQDVYLFAGHFLEKANQELGTQVSGFSDDVEALFAVYKWPGNLREMRNIVRRAVLITGSGPIGRNALPQEMFCNTAIATAEPAAPQSQNSSASLHKMNEENEKELIIKTLNDTRFNKSKAARILKIDRKTLYNKMEKYGLL
ncbi:sigma-54-dependent transcriptional regulator [Roseivirga sp. BDSF3-8]|uniref:sigma-54-dependent transcriptional regulator n=1 Tax=Roseivirga sp. BDSF3-8 TaxID=3241598 RepID=UPI0035325054